MKKVYGVLGMATIAAMCALPALAAQPLTEAQMVAVNGEQGGTVRYHLDNLDKLNHLMDGQPIQLNNVFYIQSNIFGNNSIGVRNQYSRPRR